MDASTGRVRALADVSCSLPGSPLMTKSCVPGGMRLESERARWAMYALVVSSLTSRSSAALSLLGRLELRRGLLVAVLLLEEVAQRRDVERRADEDEREQREPTEVRARRVLAHARRRATRPTRSGRC